MLLFVKQEKKYHSFLKWNTQLIKQGYILKINLVPPKASRKLH